MSQKSHRRVLLVFTAICAITGLNGCASLNEQECRTADWRLIGYEDGAAGKSPLRISDHREACADVGVTPDLDAYRQGYGEGLKLYCRPATAFSRGKQGSSYPGLCAREGDEDLRQAYRDGKRVRALSNSVSQAKQRLAEHEAELEQVRQTMASHQAEIITGGTGPARRKQILAELVTLAKEEERLPDEIEVLKRELRTRQRLLKKLESQLSY